MYKEFVEQYKKAVEEAEEMPIKEFLSLYGIENILDCGFIKISGKSLRKCFDAFYPIEFKNSMHTVNYLYKLEKASMSESARERGKNLWDVFLDNAVRAYEGEIDGSILSLIHHHRNQHEILDPISEYLRYSFSFSSAKYPYLWERVVFELKKIDKQSKENSHIKHMDEILELIKKQSQNT